MSNEQVGVVLESGPSDWQIVQQDARGFGALRLAGRWVGEPKGTVEVRLAFEDTGVSVTRDLDWRAARTTARGRWSATLSRIPAGGLYRLETRYRPKGRTAGEWAPRGDMRHLLGVGDLWVIAGQSNSAGYGRGPVSDPPELGVHLFRNSEQWALATHPMNESTDTRHPVNREGGNPGHSPYLYFGKLLRRELNHPIGLVQTALGGSPLSAWDPGEKGTPVLFDNMLRCVEKAGGRVRGVLWYQGESDAGPGAAETYARRFARAVRGWRKALNHPGLPVITVQLNRVFGVADPQADRAWTVVRDAQRRVPGRLANVGVVPSFDVPLSDGIHISPAGHMVLGERLARAALGLAHDRPVDWQAPEIRSARRAGKGRAIVLSFAPVTSRIDSINPVATPFVVEDAGGAVPVEKVLYTFDHRVRLVLGRALRGRAAVHGGYGTDPAVMPMDAERFLPVLGFYGVPVE